VPREDMADAAAARKGVIQRETRAARDARDDFDALAFKQGNDEFCACGFHFLFIWLAPKLAGGENKKPRRLAPAGFFQILDKSLPSDVAYDNDYYDH
jgi:hypothetical protein